MVKRTGSRKWILILGAVLLCELVTAYCLHDSNHEIATALKSGDEIQQAKALYVLANRHTPDEAVRNGIQSLLTCKNPLIQELLMTSNFNRFGFHQLLRKNLKSIQDPDQAFRCEFLLRFQIGGKKVMTFEDLDRYLKSLNP